MRMIARIWWCGDEWCDCTEPQIATIGRPRFPEGIREVVWHGTFRTDGEPGADEELAQVAEIMRREWPKAYAWIEWPADRSEWSYGR